MIHKEAEAGNEEKSRVGICWEIVELHRKYLKAEEIEATSYFLVIPSKNFYCHSLLTFKDNYKYYWIEGSFKDLKGVREYNSLEELFSDILLNFHKVVNIDNLNLNNVKIYEYEPPHFGIGCVEFYFHCFRGKNLTDKYLKNSLKLIEEEINK